MPVTVDDKLNDGLQLHGMSVETFAKLADLFSIPKASKAKLYESFRGGKALDTQTAVKLWKVWEKVADLVQRAKPFPIALDDANHIKLLLDVVDDGVDIAVGIAVNAEKDF